MFARFVSWVREAFRRMLGQSSFKTAMQVDVALPSLIADAITRWSLMYVNQASWLTADVRSLGLPAAIAGELARMITIEMKVEVTGGPRATWLQEQYDAFADRLPEFIEYGCAKGGLIMKPYVSGGSVAVDFVQADQFYPVGFDASGNITAVIFADQRQIGNQYYTRLEYHQMIHNYQYENRIVASGVAVENRVFKSSVADQLGSAVLLDAVPEWAVLEPTVIFHDVERPLYGYFRYPLANHVDTTSPLGVSCYARAESIIEDADRQYWRLKWEFASGERALYVDETALGRTTSSDLPTMPDKRLYRTIPGMTNIGEGDLFKDWTPEFRDASIQSGLDSILKRIEFNCGLAYGTLSDPQSVEKTATEIAAARQRSQSTVANGQKALRIALDQLFYAMDAYTTIYTLAPAGTYTVTQTYDDSLITDHDSQFNQDQRVVMMGAMSKVRFLVRNYGLSEEEAKRWVTELQQEQQANEFFPDGQGANA